MSDEWTTVSAFHDMHIANWNRISQWKGKPPPIDAYLKEVSQGVDKNDYLHLLDLLLYADAEYLQFLTGKPSTKQDLIDLRPEFTDQIVNSQVARDLDRGLAIPKRIGRFRVIAEIGGGGEADVYLAEDPRFERNVLVKLLHEQRLDAWPRREAQLLASISHPNCASVYEEGVFVGRPYLVMEYLPCPSLAEYFRGDKVATEDEIVNIMIQLFGAVGYLHDRYIFHCDIKPENILIQPDNHKVWLIDFGMATIQSGQLHSEEKCAQFHGTVAYMAPDRARRDPHHQPRLGDLFCLGGVLLWLMTKKRPFEGLNEREVLFNSTREQFDDQAIASAFSRFPRLAPICGKLLEPDPGKRFQEARHGVDELRALSNARQSLTVARSVQSPFSLMVLIAAIIYGTGILRTILARPQNLAAQLLFSVILASLAFLAIATSIVVVNAYAERIYGAGLTELMSKKLLQLSRVLKNFSWTPSWDQAALKSFDAVFGEALLSKQAWLASLGVTSLISVATHMGLFCFSTAATRENTVTIVVSLVGFTIRGIIVNAPSDYYSFATTRYFLGKIAKASPITAVWWMGCNLFSSLAIATITLTLVLGIAIAIHGLGDLALNTNFLASLAFLGYFALIALPVILTSFASNLWAWTFLLVFYANKLVLNLVKMSGVSQKMVERLAHLVPAMVFLCIFALYALLFVLSFLAIGFHSPDLLSMQLRQTV